VRTIGARAIRLYPLYHPAAALYTPSTLEVLRADFHRIPELLALGAPEQPALVEEEIPEVAEEVPEVVKEVPEVAEIPEVVAPEPDLSAHDADPADSSESAPEIVQLGLF
jgi:uracil-DNA glycosylase